MPTHGYINIDESVIAGINTGDENAFTQLYNAYFTYLCVCATTFIHDSSRAQDIVNELFVRIWLHRGSLRWPVHGYLTSSLRNACLNELRNRKEKNSPIDSELLEFACAQCSHTPLQYTEYLQLVSTVNKISASLPAKCRNIFRMYFHEGLSSKEIATRLHLSPSTVRVQIKIALDRIREEIGQTYLILLLLNGLLH